MPKPLLLSILLLVLPSTGAAAGAGGAVETRQPPAPAAAPGTAGAPEHPVLGLEIPIEDPSGRAMRNLHEALARAAAGKGQARLLFFGASHTSSDLITGYIRKKLQRRLGDAGHGFVMPAKPWKYYRHADVNIKGSKGWKGLRVRAADQVADYYGIAGTALESSSKKDYGRLITTKDNTIGRKVSRYRLFYLRQPEGGRFDVRIDGRRARRISTKSDEPEPGYETFEVTDAGHRFEVRPRGDGPVRIFGVAMERDVPGVIVDTLGIPGSRVRYHLLWNDRLYREQLALLSPDLVALAYGTNEAGDDDVPISLYEDELRRVLIRIREIVPKASCLLIGPSDRPIKGEGEEEGTWLPRPRTEAIISVQRRVSAELGCGFFDLVAFQGGPMSMVLWASVDPPMGAPDHVHFTRRGYRRLAEVLLSALLKGSGMVIEDE